MQWTGQCISAFNNILQHLPYLQFKHILINHWSEACKLSYFQLKFNIPSGARTLQFFTIAHRIKYFQLHHLERIESTTVNMCVLTNSANATNQFNLTLICFEITDYSYRFIFIASYESRFDWYFISVWIILNRKVVLAIFSQLH